MNEPLYPFLFIFAFIGLGILLDQAGVIIYDTWIEWRRDDKSR